MPPKQEAIQRQSSLLSFFGKSATPKKIDVVKETIESLKEETTESLEVTQVDSNMDVDNASDIAIPPPSPISDGRNKKRFSYKEADSDSENESLPVKNPFAAGKTYIMFSLLSR